MRVPHTPPSSLTLIAFALISIPSVRAADTAPEQEALPIHLVADQAEVKQGQYAYAEGNVDMTQGTLHAESDWVKYNLVSGQLHAGNRVKITQNGDVLIGKRVDLAVDDHVGEMDSPEYTMSLGGIRGSGETLYFEGKDRYRIKQGNFTTCPANNNDWYIHARELNLDYVEGVGDAWHGWFEFQSVPVFYYPWLDFPLDDNRKTGLLFPTFGYSSSNGFEYSQPFYWDIAPNYDATITPSWHGKRGLMLGGEFRYLQNDFAGLIRAEAIKDKERESDSNRYSLMFQHQQQLSDRLRLRIDYQKVSDDNYFDNFGNSLEASSQTSLPREAELTYNGTWWNSSLRWKTFQTLQSQGSPVTPPYDLAPQLRVNASPDVLPYAKTSIIAEATDFQQNGATSGWRTWARPSISTPYANSYSFITPKLSLDATQYRLDNQNGTGETTLDRVLPVASIDSGLFFEREAELGDLGFIQTLEPRAFYLYTPYKDQSQIPLFDTSEPDLNWSRLFSENRFTGHDRINDANDLTLALTSRVISTDDGNEIMHVGIGQRIYFQDPQVGLHGNSTGQSSADTLFSIGANIQDIHTTYDLQYNFQNAITQRASLNVAWIPETYKVINLRYLRQHSNDEEQLSLSGQWPIWNNWYAVGLYSYSLQDRSSLETLAGLEYNAGCWGLRLAAQRYPTDKGQYNVNFFAVLEFSGLGGVGSNPLSLVQRSIPNYADTIRPSPLRTR